MIYKQSSVKEKLKKCSLIATAVITMVISTKNCYAKSYEIENASFNVELQRDGSSIITESWDIEFDGEYSRFYKDIYTKLNDAEKFNNFDVLNVTIDGVNSTPVSNDKDRIDNTYYINESKDKITIEWFKNISNQKVNYEITYKIDDIVKETDNNKALFAYRFVGLNFNDKIRNTYLKINLPSSENVQIHNYVGFNKYNQYGNLLEFSGENKNGLYKVSVLMNLEDFDKLKFAPLKSLKNSEGNIIVEIITLVTLLLVSVILIAYAVIESKKIKHKVEKIIKEEPNYIEDLAKRYENMDFNIADISVLYQRKMNFYLLLNTTLLYLNYKGKCEINKEKIKIKKDVLNEENLYSDIVKVLVEMIDNEEVKSFYELKISSLTEKVKSDKKIIKEITKIYDSYYKTRKKELKEKYYIKVATNESQVISSVISELPEYKSTFMYDYFSLAEENKLTYTILFSMIFTIYGKEKNNMDLKSTNLLLLYCIYNDDCLYKEHSSSSSSSGCSSCSSCSGCGGGGAD